jgi:hypothetical protein
VNTSEDSCDLEDEGVSSKELDDLRIEEKEP